MLRGPILCICLLLCGTLGTAARSGEAAPAGGPERPDWRAEMESRLKGQVSFTINGSHQEALASLVATVDVPIVIDNELELGNGGIGMSSSGITMSHLLRWLTQTLGLTADVRPGAVYISKAGGDDAWPKKAAHVDPANDEERKADELIRRLLTGAPEELTAERKAALERVIADFGSDKFALREAASTSAGAFGREDIPLLRQAAGSKDPEVAERAKAAIAALERASGLKDQLAKLPGARKYVAACAAEAAWEWTEKAKAVIAADKDPKADLHKLLDEANATARRAAVLGEAARGAAKGR
jgi:hypothetical protein